MDLKPAGTDTKQAQRPVEDVNDDTSQLEDTFFKHVTGYVNWSSSFGWIDSESLTSAVDGQSTRSSEGGVIFLAGSLFCASNLAKKSLSWSGKVASLSVLCGMGL